MTQVFRRMVSQNRRRYVNASEGLDLDLTYILPNLIAMGFPAENYERFYRNNISDVVRFFELRHPGHYRIYNLCSERSYDPARFRNNVVVFPFEDHQPPCIPLIKSCCDDIHDWLRSDRENVAAIHCKAGKGRTGLIICCYLLHSRFVHTHDEALAFYGEARTVDSNGVTIPSQRRYIRLYNRLLQSNLIYRDLPALLQRLEIANCIVAEEFIGLEFTIFEDKREIWTGDMLPLRQASNNLSASDNIRIIDLIPPLPICGDVLVECYGIHPPLAMTFASLFPRREKIFQFWLNTFFIGDDIEETRRDENADQVALCVTRNHLDLLTKDKNWRNFPSNFQVTLWFSQR